MQSVHFTRRETSEKEEKDSCEYQAVLPAAAFPTAGGAQNARESLRAQLHRRGVGSLGASKEPKQRTVMMIKSLKRRRKKNKTTETKIKSHVNVKGIQL